MQMEFNETKFESNYKFNSELAGLFDSNHLACYSELYICRNAY